MRKLQLQSLLPSLSRTQLWRKFQASKLPALLAGFGLSFGVPAYAGFTPIALNTNSFNHDPVVEASAPASLNDAVNATMDGGTNKNGNTWYEIGYNPNAPTTGFPPHGSVVSSNGVGGSFPGNFSFQMPADYHGNNVVLVGHNNGGRTPLVPGGTLVVNDQGIYNGLAFLCSAGNGPLLFGVNIHHSDTSVETVTPLTALDWFNGGPRVYNCAGRVSLGGGVQNVGAAPAGALFAVTAPCTPGTRVTSVDFFFVGGNGNGNTNNNGRAMFFAISGTTDGVNYTNMLAVSGFNYNAIVPADAVPTTGTTNSASGTLTNNVTFTMDGGTSKTNNTWFEQGYYAAFPSLGLPTAGSTVSSDVLPASYTMPPTYAQNCAVCVSSNVTSANITFQTPGSYGALSFLCAAANGDTVVPCVVSFSDGSSETNALYIPDWFTRNIPSAHLCFARVNPVTRTLNNTMPEFVSPYAVPGGMPGFDYRALGLPTVRLFDAVIPIANSGGVITNISVSFTNGPGSNRTVAILAVSGAPANQVPPVFGTVGNDTVGQPNFYPTPGQPTYYFNPSNRIHAVVNNPTYVKLLQGPITPRSAALTPILNGNGVFTGVTINDGGAGYNYVPVITVNPNGPGTGATLTASVFNGAIIAVAVGNGGTNYTGSTTLTVGPPPSGDINLSVTNTAGSGPISYQWMKAPLGEGLHDINYSIDYNTFANLTDGGRVSGSTSSALAISAPQLTDSADYLLVASNPYGSVTSRVMTVMIMTTNQNVFSGVPAGDVITPTATDSTPAAESLDHVVDTVAQKWLSDGLQFSGACCGGPLPWVGYDPLGLRQVGYIVQPVAGASIVSSLRIFTANDTNGRDPSDVGVEGSSDGVNFTHLVGKAFRGTYSLPTGRNGTGSALLDPLTGFCVEVDFANATGYKFYRVTITNNFNLLGDALMQVAEIQLLGTLVPNPPVWVRQPEPSVTVFAGGSPSFTVQASGYPLPRYQWLANGSPIPGATGATYTLPNAQPANSGTNFSCIASNTFGNITSSSATLTIIAAPTQPYPAAIVSNAPVAYFRLDEGPDNGTGNSGVVAHDHMGGHDGYYSNSIIALNGYNPVADTDTSAGFGSSGFATPNSFVAEILDLDFSRSTTSTNGGVFSVEAWAFGGQQVTNGAIVTKGYNGVLNAGTGTGTEQFVLDVAGTGPANRTFRFLVRDAAGNGHFAQGSGLPTDLFGNATWHHLVGVCDQPHGNVLLYVDGVLAGTGTIGSGAGILTQPLPVEIGARQTGGATDFTDQWDGAIDEVAIYNKVLTPAQILAHFYAAQRAPLITLSPTNTTVNDNTSVILPSQAYGPGTLSFQWYNSDGVNPTTPIGGATSSNYTFTATPAQNLAYYQVVVANAFGSATSLVAQLTVSSGAPVTGNFLTDLPASQTVGVGHVLVLHVQPNGTAPFTYNWQRNGVNLSDDFRTFGSHTDTLTIGYGAYTDTANYQVLVSNGAGSAQSTLDAVTVTNITSTFFNAGSTTTDWQLNNGSGNPAVLYGTNAVELTHNLGNTANSAFLKTPRNIGSFTATFTYQLVTPNGGGADGITFCIQNDGRGATAVGGGGGALAVSGITPSYEFELNIYAPNTRGYAFDTGGNAGPFTSLLPNVGIGDNTNPVKVELNYNGSVLTAKLTDLVTLGTSTVNNTVNIPTVVGGTTAYVGFTGADGGVNSTQIISWGGNPAPTPIPLTFNVVGNNIVLSWPASAGAYLMNSPALGGAASWTQDGIDTFRVVNGQAQVTVPPGGAGRFFRLLVFP